MHDRPPFPPFTTDDDARQKVRLAEDAWNTRDPEFVATAYTLESAWHVGTELLTGRQAIIGFLRHKWSTERQYRLIKELWGYRGNRMAVRFAYEWHDADGAWLRAYGNELWEFDEHGLMQRRFASSNALAITDKQRLFHWPLGRRPDDHAGLSDLNL